MKKPLSLTFRLFLCVSALNLMTMLVIGLLSLRSIHINVSEDYDAQLITEASILWEVLEENSKNGALEAIKAETFDVEHSTALMEHEEQDSMMDYAQWRAFRVWKGDKILMDSDSTNIFSSDPVPAGFSTIKVGNDTWRAFSLHDKSNNLVVATFENLHDRDILRLDILLDVLAPLIIMLPILALLFSFGVGFGLKDLRKVAHRIATRSFTDLSRLESNDLPKELKPLTQSVNQLLASLEASLAHEREFIDHAAHELRTPLSALKLQAQLLTKSMKDPQSGPLLDELLASVNRTAKLVDQLLLLSRVSQQEIHLESVNIHNVLKEAISMLSGQVSEKNLHLAFECGTSLTIASQPELMRTLFATILDNAVKYTPKDGNINISVETSSERVTVNFADSGEGISEDQRTQVFDRFYRIPTTKQSGSGLGLAIAKQIAQMLNAEIYLKTPEIGKGLLVSIVFSLT
jgi:two-component system sensor histidine kinase QseC